MIGVEVILISCRDREWVPPHTPLCVPNGGEGREEPYTILRGIRQGSREKKLGSGRDVLIRIKLIVRGGKARRGYTSLRKKKSGKKNLLSSQLSNTQGTDRLQTRWTSDKKELMQVEKWTALKSV